MEKVAGPATYGETPWPGIQGHTGKRSLPLTLKPGCERGEGRSGKALKRGWRVLGFER